MNEVLFYIECVGIASAAMSGFLFAIKKKCDWLGVFISSFLTALGGGITRDVLVFRPIYSFTHYTPVLIVIFVMFFTYATKIHKKSNEIEKKFIFIFTDAIDVICFSIVGAIIATEYNYNVFGVVLIAFSNGVGGGILRDIILNEIPWFFRTGLYGTISMLVGLIYFILDYFDISNMFSVIVLLISGIVFRMFAYYRNWKLPPLG